MKIKKLIRRFTPTIRYYYKYLGYRLFLFLGVSTLVGLMDGLGIAMFLPLLEMASSEGQVASGEGLGNLDFILRFLNYLGLSISLPVVLGTMLTFFFLKGLAKYGSTSLGVNYQAYFVTLIRYESLKALRNFKFEKYIEADAGQIQNSLTSEALKVTFSFRHYIQVQQQIILVVSYMALAMLANIQFTLFVAIGGVLTNVIFRVMFRKTKQLSLEMVDANNLFQGLLLQTTHFFKYLKATNSFNEFDKKLKKEVDNVVEKEKAMGNINAFMAGLREPLMMLVVISVILINVFLLQQSLASIVLSLLFFYRGISSVMNLQSSYNKFLTTYGSIRKFKFFVEYLRENAEQNGLNRLLSFKNKIVFTDVYYSVRQKDSNNIPILRNINLTIERNESLAIVGESGSGKTTLVNIICGLLRPNEGSIVVDQIDYNNLDISKLQERIGYITQEAVVFSDTIFNNVTCWSDKTEATIKRFWSAVEKARVKDFIKSLPNRENSELGSSGINLSGGQRQRISIARELYKEIDILIMDEATSALDSETESQIQKSLDGLKGKYTLITIAHRLSTIKDADKVLVMKNGAIDAYGTYTELLMGSPSFSKMIQLQELS